MNNINKMIKDTLDIFDAVQHVGNIVARKAGYNKDYNLPPDLIVTYELFDHGPECVYSGQYRHLADKEYGAHIDPTKETGLTQDEIFRAMDKAYRKITVRKGGDIVCVIEGAAGFRMTEHVKCAWEDELKRLADETFHDV